MADIPRTVIQEQLRKAKDVAENLREQYGQNIVNMQKLEANKGQLEFLQQKQEGVIEGLKNILNPQEKPQLPSKPPVKKNKLRKRPKITHRKKPK